MRQGAALLMAVLMMLTSFGSGSISPPDGGALPATGLVVADANDTIDRTNTFPFDAYFENYHNYAPGDTDSWEQNEMPTIADEMFAFADQYPDIVRLYDLTTLVPNGQTWWGNHIYAIKISDGVVACPEGWSDAQIDAALAAEECEPAYYDNPDEETFFIVGNHHAREWMSTVTPLYFIYYLTHFYGAPPTDNDGDGLVNEDPLDGVDNDGDGEQGGRVDAEGRAMWDGIDNDGDGIIDEGIDEDPIEARVTHLIDTREIWIVPQINIDGFRWDRADPSELWRKNMRDNDENDKQGDICDGVDINRNYPLEWSHNTQPYAVVEDGGLEFTVDDDNPCSGVYHGPQDDFDDDGDSFLGYDIVQQNPIYDPDGVDEDPEDVTHIDDDGDGLVDEDRTGGFSEPETQVIEQLVWRLDIWDYEAAPWDPADPGMGGTGSASRWWPAMWSELPDGTFARNYRPEKHDGRHNFVSAISYHSCSALYIWPWGFKGEDPPHESLMADLAAPLMNWTEYGNWKEEGGYKVSGDITDWLYGNHGIMAYTIELNQCGSQGNLSGGFHADKQLIKPTVRMHLLSNIWMLEKSPEVQIAKEGNRFPTIAAVRYPELEIETVYDDYRYVNDDYPLRVRVHNADHLAKDSLEIRYRVSGGAWQTVPMACYRDCTAQDSTFRGVIPSVEESGKVEYYVVGRDLRAANSDVFGGGWVFSGYGEAAPQPILVDDIVGFGNPVLDAIAVGFMMLIIYGVIWGGLYHMVGLAIAAERRKQAAEEGG